MPKLNWNSNDFRNSQDSSGTVADTISRSGSLQQGYFHGSLTKGLVAYYPMESGSGSTLVDSTALSNNGTLNPGSSGTTSAENMWTTGKLGDHALSFDGVDDYVELFSKGFSRWTISSWINAGDSQSDGYTAIFGPAKQRWATGTIQFFIENNNNTLYVDAYDLDRTNLPVTSTSNILDSSWHHVVTVYDGSSIKLYVDGTQEASISTSGSTTPITHSLAAADNGTNQRLNGKLDAVRIYDRKLSEPEIKALYNLSRPSKVTPGDTL